jgi:hypothetical protein
MVRDLVNLNMEDSTDNNSIDATEEELHCDV